MLRLSPSAAAYFTMPQKNEECKLEVNTSKTIDISAYFDTLTAFQTFVAIWPTGQKIKQINGMEVSMKVGRYLPFCETFTHAATERLVSV